MASTTGPDIDTGRTAVENLMDDACIISADIEGVGDDVLDEDTGWMEPPVPGPDSPTQYNQASTGINGRSLADAEATGGKCKVKPASDTEIARYVGEGGVNQAQVWYVLGLPWDAPIMPLNSVATITSSRRDPALVSTELVLRAPHNVGTLLVSRKYLCEVRT